MTHITGFIEDTKQPTLHYQRWSPDAAPLAVIAFVHGVGGHSGQSTFRYLVEWLVDAGYELYGVDLRGHGRSGGRRCSINRWEEYRTDVRRLLHKIRSEREGIPTFLLGQSLGGLVVIDFALYADHDVRGVIASAPALFVRETSAAVSVALLIMSLIAPHRFLGRKIDLSGASRDSEEVAKLLNDPLTDPKLSYRLTAQTLSALRNVKRNAGKLNVPLLLLHGAADPITPCEGSSLFYSQVKNPDKAIAIYEGGFHQPFIDIDRERVFEDVADWIQNHR